MSMQRAGRSLGKAWRLGAQSQALYQRAAIHLSSAVGVPRRGDDGDEEQRGRGGRSRQFAKPDIWAGSAMSQRNSWPEECDEEKELFTWAEAGEAAAEDSQPAPGGYRRLHTCCMHSDLAARVAAAVHGGAACCLALSWRLPTCAGHAACSALSSH